MLVREMTISASKGLHARPVAELVRAASLFESEIIMTFQGEAANVKSLMSLLALGVTSGSKVSLTILGKDENEALEALEKVIRTLAE